MSVVASPSVGPAGCAEVRPGHLFLSGYMAVGKSTVGAALATTLGLPFTDLDQRITEAAGASPAEILQVEGEPAFRAWERACLAPVLVEPPQVVALGGGTVVDPAVRARVRAAGTLVTLSLSAAGLRARLADAVDRPLAAGADPLARLEERTAAYAEADAQVSLDGLAPLEGAHAVLTQLPSDRVAAWQALGRRAGQARGVGPGATLGQPAEPVARTTLSVGLPTRSAARYPVHFALGDEGAWVAWVAANGRRALLVTDDRVAPLHGARVLARLREAGVQASALVMPAGEGHKTLAGLGSLAEAALASGVDRQTVVVALGGGVVGDVAGLLAALLLRGLPCVQVPTTLLAQVDASVGGKTAVNHGGAKNQLGVFAPPAAVFVDGAYLATLSLRDRRAGLAEVVKHGALADPALLPLAQAVGRAGVPADTATLELVRRAVRVKAAVVAADERESGARRLLNLGHTVGHGLEAAHLDRLRHGEAVALGLVVAARLSVETGHLAPAEAERLVTTLVACGLPVDPVPWLVPAAIERVALDKKVRGEYVDLVLLKALGHAVIVPFTIDALRARLWAWRVGEWS